MPQPWPSASKGSSWGQCSPLQWLPRRNYCLDISMSAALGLRLHLAEVVERSFHLLLAPLRKQRVSRSCSLLCLVYWLPSGLYGLDFLRWGRSGNRTGRTVQWWHEKIDWPAQSYVAHRLEAIMFGSIPPLPLSTSATGIIAEISFSKHAAPGVVECERGACCGLWHECGASTSIFST